MTAERCAGLVLAPGSWTKYHCRRAATIQEDGKWWCVAHAPSKVKARRQARDDAWDAKCEAEDKAQAEAKQQRQREADRLQAREAAYAKLLEAAKAALKYYGSTWPVGRDPEADNLAEAIAAVEKAEGV